MPLWAIEPYPKTRRRRTSNRTKRVSVATILEKAGRWKWLNSSALQKAAVVFRMLIREHSGSSLWRERKQNWVGKGTVGLAGSHMPCADSIRSLGWEPRLSCFQWQQRWMCLPQQRCATLGNTVLSQQNGGISPSLQRETPEETKQQNEKTQWMNQGKCTQEKTIQPEEQWNPRTRHTDEDTEHKENFKHTTFTNSHGRAEKQSGSPGRSRQDPRERCWQSLAAWVPGLYGNEKSGNCTGDVNFPEWVFLSN